MKIEPLRHGKTLWLLGRNPRNVSPDDLITGEIGGAGVSRIVHDAFWSREKWASTKGFAMTFDSEAAARDYLASNRARIEDAD